MPNATTLAAEPHPFRFNVTQYYKMGELGFFDDTRVELIDGRVIVKYVAEPFRYTREQYRRMGEAGFFDGARVQLLDGEIVQMSPMGGAHAVAIMLAGSVLQRVFGPEYSIRTQLPLSLAGPSDPEPDVAVVKGPARNFVKQHPSTAVLVVEVSDTTLAYDRTEKAALYARAGIPEYWIVNLNDRVLEILRAPAPDANAPKGHRYFDLQTVDASGTATALEQPDRMAAVSDLLP